MQTEIYTLPELTFVGGKTQDLRFILKDSSGRHYDASGSELDFSVCNYSNKTGNPLFSVEPTLTAGENNVSYIIDVVIPSNMTVGLYGKFIYQITIRTYGRVEIPNQGIMNITKNINTQFIS